jgi:hypothetical protein
MSRFPGRPPVTLLPTYSLTGDLLNYVRCSYQYRLFTRTGIRESHPVQRWYGQFLHRGMRQAYRRWSEGAWQPADYRWQESPEPPFSDLREAVTQGLRAEGLYRPANLGDSAERRLVRAIRVLGPCLFPLIKEAEVRLNGVRRFGKGRDDLYQVTGVVDVLASASLESFPPGENALVDHLRESIAELATEDQSEIVVDYKGISRQEMDKRLLEVGHRQVVTYAWLRRRQHGAGPVHAGMLLFVNDLLRDDDDPNADPDPKGLKSLIETSAELVPVREEEERRSLRFFDETVSEIEARVGQEGARELWKVWNPRPEAKTCAACDARWHCPESAVEGDEYDRPPSNRPLAPAAP